MRIELPSANTFASEAYSANLFAGGTARIEQVGADTNGDHVYDNSGNSSLALRTDSFYDVELSLHHASSETTVTFKINGADVDSRPVSAIPDLSRAATVRFGIDNFATEPTTVLFDDVTIDYVTE